MRTSDRYLKIVEWSEEDQCYVGTCPGLMLGGVHGADEVEVYRELCQAAEEWIAVHGEDGDPLPPPTASREYSGKFMLRTGPDLHKRLAIRAMTEGMSLNAYCVEVLAVAPGTVGVRDTPQRRYGRRRR